MARRNLDRTVRSLESHQAIVQLIAAATTRTGLTVQAELDHGDYPKDIEVSDQPMAALPPTRHDFHGGWNYNIHPHHPGSRISTSLFRGTNQGVGPRWTAATALTRERVLTIELTRGPPGLALPAPFFILLSGVVRRPGMRSSGSSTSSAGPTSHDLIVDIWMSVPEQPRVDARRRR